jgi:hypothetical protein
MSSLPSIVAEVKTASEVIQTLITDLMELEVELTRLTRAKAAQRLATFEQSQDAALLKYEASKRHVCL